MPCEAGKQCVCIKEEALRDRITKICSSGYVARATVSIARPYVCDLPSGYSQPEAILLSPVIPSPWGPLLQAICAISPSNIPYTHPPPLIAVLLLYLFRSNPLSLQIDEADNFTLQNGKGFLLRYNVTIVCYSLNFMSKNILRHSYLNFLFSKLLSQSLVAFYIVQVIDLHIPF